MFESIKQLFGGKKGSKDGFINRCVLIVDDNESDRILVQRTIEKMGHRVLMAENGVIGLQIAKAERPDLILSDCRMPEMDGIEMFKRLKDDPDTKDIRLVFLTGVGTPKTVIECFDIGVDNYMCKPINPRLLATQIRTIFDGALPSN